MKKLKKYLKPDFELNDYILRCSNEHELRDFYFHGEGDYIQHVITDLLNSFEKVEVFIYD